MEQLTVKNVRFTVGARQTTKAVLKDLAQQVFIAADADIRLIDPLELLCKEKGVPVETAPTMADLGRACGIKVGTAAAAILK